MGSSNYIVLIGNKKIIQFFADGVSIRKKQFVSYPLPKGGQLPNNFLVAPPKGGVTAKQFSLAMEYPSAKNWKK